MTIEPLLDGAQYGYAVWPGGPLPFAPFATLTEAEGISCKMIAGYHHDHIFMHWGRREDSVAVLRRLLNA